MRKRILFTAIVLVVLLGITGVWKFQSSVDIKEDPVQEEFHLFKDIPRKGTVTMLDLGANSCIPCKMMASIMEKLEKEYKGKADIIFIDVGKYPEQVKRFKIRAIPTQIFYNKDRKDVYRHEGFLKEELIVGKLKFMGVK